MDGFWTNFQDHSEHNMSTEFNPFPTNTNVPSQPEDLVEVTPSQFNNRPVQCRKRRAKPIPSGRKLSNFTVDEDRVLVAAWLNVSTDPIVSTGQRAESYWKRISDSYNAHRGNYPERTQKSLNKRWDSIKENVSHFCGFYQQVLNRNQSGTTDSDKTSEAITLFASIMDRPFTMTHCWDILKNEVKWLDLQNKGKEVQGRGATQDAGNLPAFDDNGSNSVSVDGACSSPSKGLGKRPIGRDTAKDCRKRSSSSSQSQQSSSEFLSRMNDLNLQKLTFMKDNSTLKEQRVHSLIAIEERKVAAKEFMMQVEAERISMERQRMERENKREDERILAIDLNTCNPEQKAYYKAMKDSIMARFRSGTGSV